MTTKSRYVRKSSTQPSLTPSQSAEVKRQVDRVLAKQKDYKICTSEVSSTNVDFSGTVYNLLTNMSRGDNARNNYEGSHIQIKNIHVRGQVACADLSNVVRIIIFQWMDDTSPLVTSVLDNTGIIGTVNAPYASRNWSNRPLFRIFRDEMIQLQANTNITGGNGPVRIIDYFIKSNKLMRTYYAATSNVIQKGGIWMIVVSDSGAAPDPDIIFTSEIIYTD